ncbi:MAG: hypothetical protein AAB629_02930, partial [Patescibacteria group bacterium]
MNLKLTLSLLLLTFSLFFSLFFLIPGDSILAQTEGCNNSCGIPDCSPVTSPPDPDGTTYCYCCGAIVCYNELPSNPGQCYSYSGGSGCTPSYICGGGDGGPTLNTFSVAIEPSVGTANQGQGTSYTVTVTPDNYTGTVTLSSVGDCGTNNITCSFPGGNTADLSTGTVYKDLRVDTTSGTGINNYTITVTGTDTVPEPDLVDSASATLQVKDDPTLYCDSAWRNMPRFLPLASKLSALRWNYYGSVILGLFAPFNS